MPSEKQMIIKAVADLKELPKLDDAGQIHIESDKILMRFVPQEVKEAREKVDRWYCVDT